MKNKIFMYLFIFSLLLILFQFVNSKNILETYEKKIERLEGREQQYEDSIITFADLNLELMRFNIDYNEDAQDYFEDDGYKTKDLLPFIKDELYKLNVYEGDDHPIVPYASMTENKILINSVRLLNHKWIIADFSDGKHWGEILVHYEIVNREELKFKLLDYLMYRPN